MLEWPVSRRRLESEKDLARRIAFEQRLKASMFDAAGKCPAAHNPGVDKKSLPFLPPFQHGNFAERAELIPIAGYNPQRSRARQAVFPVGFRIADTVQVELIRLIDQLQSPR